MVGFTGVVFILVGVLAVINTQPTEGSPTPGTCLPVSKGGTGVCSQEDLIDLFYPIGFIYTSTSSTNPGDYLGGTWEAFGDGQTLVGVDTGQTEFNTVEKTGGAKTHTLTTAQLPQFSFGFDTHGSEIASAIRSVHATGGTVTAETRNNYMPLQNTTGGATSQAQPKWTFGSNQSHNNLQPYITVYFWKRTS